MQKQQLSQKMLQKLSPQQIQLMKLLQIPTDMLEQRIQEELEGNPALEMDENMSSENEQEDKDSDDDIEYDEESYIIGADGKKEKELIVEESSSEVSMSTLIVDEGGTFNQTSLSNALKKASEKLINKLMIKK